MSDLQYINISWDGELAIVTIDRPEKLNALNGEVIAELGDAFDSLRHDDKVLGVILTGAGKKAFVAGADIGVFLSIERFPKPVLAAVGGFALGAGCELALACHLRLATENAKFGLPEVGLGITPGYGGTVRLARLIGLGRAVELTLTGEMVDADRAYAVGLVSGVVPREELLDQAKALLRKITKNGPVAVRMTLETIYRAMDVPLSEALSTEASIFGLLASTEDMKEGMTAFLEKRKPDFKGR